MLVDYWENERVDDKLLGDQRKERLSKLREDHEQDRFYQGFISFSPTLILKNTTRFVQISNKISEWEKHWHSEWDQNKYESSIAIVGGKWKSQQTPLAISFEYMPQSA